MSESDLQLVADLRALGRGSDVLAEDLAGAVLDRVRELPTPVTTPRPRLSRRRLALVVAALVLALLAASPVRAAVLDWFGFGGVRVERGAGVDEPAPPPPSVSGGPSVAAAADEVDFTLLWLPELGEPRGVAVSADGRRVAMSWTFEGRPVRLDQFDAGLDYLMAKTVEDVDYAQVSGETALWFDRPHEVMLLDPDGTRRTESARLAGHTLIWTTGPTTLRLEGDLSLPEALRLAESAVPVS